MKTVILLVAIAMVCCAPAFAHSDSNPATNLVMLSGVTCADNGYLAGGFEGFQAIKNLGRNSDPQGIVAPNWFDDFHSSGRTGRTDLVTLTITFPYNVIISGIAWNSGGVAGGYWSDETLTAQSIPHWTATLDGATIVDKDCDTGGLGGSMGTMWQEDGNPQPHMYDPCGDQDERVALAEAVTGRVLVLSFTPIDRAGGWYFSARDINVSTVPEPSSIFALLTGCAGFASMIRRKRG